MREWLVAVPFIYFTRQSNKTIMWKIIKRLFSKEVKKQEAIKVEPISTHILENVVEVEKVVSLKEEIISPKDQGVSKTITKRPIRKSINISVDD